MRINADKIREYREEHGISIFFKPWNSTFVFIKCFSIYIKNICDNLDFIAIDVDELFEEYNI